MKKRSFFTRRDRENIAKYFRIHIFPNAEKVVQSLIVKHPVLGNAIPVLGVKLKRGLYVLWSFFKIALCSAISFKRSRRELSIDVAEHRSTLRNNQKTPV